MAHTSREEIEVVAASLCDVFNGAFAWDVMTEALKTNWRTRALAFQREIVAHEWVIVGADELPDGVK